MSTKLTKEQKWALLEGIADGRPLAALAGIVGVSSPTVMNRLSNPEFLGELVDLFTAYDDDTIAWLDCLEYWWRRPLERQTQRALRQRVAKLIRAKFHAEDVAEQEEARRRGWLARGGLTWKWSEQFERWTYGAGFDNWWVGSIGG